MTPSEIRETQQAQQEVAAIPTSWDNPVLSAPSEIDPLISKSPSDSSTTEPTVEATTSRGTVLYLAYGSNLSSETFLGARGIKPLSAQNVHVPSLDLTFDLAGFPYVEPCFANSRWRVHNPPKSPYHQGRWTKGLVGVVYEVTIPDYRTIIASEGGGASYKDVVVDCYPLKKGAISVSDIPADEAFKAHTLLCPSDGKKWYKIGRLLRPNPSYAQPSARYLKLITDGADEHKLPTEYKDYLHGIRPYTVTTRGQRVGRYIYVSVFRRILFMLFAFSRKSADKKGKLPQWLARVLEAFFMIMWLLYDWVFRWICGNGERSIADREEVVSDKHAGII